MNKDRRITPPDPITFRDKASKKNKSLSIDEKKAFIFDFDLTIADTRKSAKLSFEYAIEKCGGKYNEEDLFAYLTSTLKTTFSKIDSPNCDFEEFCNVYYKKNLEVICDYTYIYPDADRLLYRLKQTGKKIAIVTNRDLKSINSFLEYKGLTNIFDAIIASEDVEKQKPDPEPINNCLERLSVDKNEAVYFGDALNDGKAALVAGVDFIYVDKHEKNVEFGFEVSRVVKNFDDFYTSDDSKTIKTCLNVISRIADDIKEKKYVVFVGPEILDNPYDETNKNNSRRKILEKLNILCEEGCDIGLKQRELLDGYLGNSYLDEIRNAPFKSNRAHELLSKLNFVSYVYFFYDSLLAKTIGEDKISVISSGLDIKRWDMFGNKTPFIYPLKQQNDGDIIFSDELDNIDQDVSNLISNICYNKNVLLIGLSNSESERILKKYEDSFKHDVVIVNEAKCLKYEKTDKTTRISARESSLILKLLYVKAETGSLSYTDMFNSDEKLVDWSIDLAYAPTPTEVIDLFLEMLKKEIKKAKSKRIKNKIEYISAVIDNGIDKIMNVKGNYASVRAFCDDLKQYIDKNKQIPNDFLSNLSVYIDGKENDRKDISTKIEMVGTKIAKKSRSNNLRVALYGRSNRVLDFLHGFSLNENMNITVYVAECSQKNKDLDYTDDYKYFEAIKQKGLNTNTINYYQIPDIMLYDLIIENNIDMILFGIHAVYVDENRRPQIIRNINGIGLFTSLALKKGIQVFMIGEKEKMRPMKELTDFSPEETNEQIYKNFKSSGINVLRNVIRNEEMNYDTRITIITEDGEYLI